MEVEKVLTDTPMLDEIVYNCKQILNDGVILKNDVKADNNETESSLVRSDLYLACIDGFATFPMFTFGEIEISQIPSITSKEIYEWSHNNDLIPEEYRDYLVSIITPAYIAGYEEENEYYRVYNGLPPMGEQGILLPEEIVPDTLKPYIEEGVFIHEYDIDVIKALETNGVIDTLLEQNPDAEYLKYIGKRKVDIYEARKADKYVPLYVGECDEAELRARFQELLETNRIIYLRSYYDEAYNYKSDYYEEFMIVMIILQTVCDMINEIPEYLIRKDVFDIRTVQYLFEASGVEFFPEIPIRYQISLVRNLNKLIKYKSTDRCIVDIVSLFGFDNIEVFKYYLLKNRKQDSDGNYVFATKLNEEGEEVEDEDACYTLNFLKVGIDELPDDAIKTEANIMDYEEVIRSDQYWNADYTEDEVRQEILDYNFNMLRTKYMSIKSVYSMSSYLFQITYFINLIMNNDIDKSLVMFTVPAIGKTMTIMDAFIYMYALAHVYYGTEDVIITDVEDSLKILGFNFDADMSEIASYLWEKGYTTMEDLGVTDWANPTGIFSFNQLMEVYTKNKNVYDHVVHEMLNANNARIYRLYKKIYDSLMLTKINLNYFTIDDEGTIASSYAEFLQYKKSDLYERYLSFLEESDETRNDKIATEVYNIACCLEEYLDMGLVPYIFNGLPAASIEAVKVYVMDIINFFKSFKVTILDLNTIFISDDKLHNTVLIIDDALFKIFFNPKEQILPNNDRISKQKNTATFKQEPEIVDHWYKSYRQYRDARSESGILSDGISSVRNARWIDEKVSIRDNVSQVAYVYDQKDDIGITKEKTKMKTTREVSEYGGISRDSVSIRYV
jgi:hypothetical protein